MSHIASVTVNALLFVAGFLACLMLDVTLAILVTGVVLLLHSRRMYPGEWRLLIQTAVLGWLFDAILYRTAVLGPSGQLPELWQLCVWLLFATTLCHSLRFVQRHLALALLAGSLIGVCWYVLQVVLTDVIRLQSWPVFLATIALSWALLLPLLAFVGKTHVLAGSSGFPGVRS